MLDYYGNYMIQSLINVCTVEQRFTFLQKIESKIALMAYDKKGTHSLQTVISVTSLEKEVLLIVNSIENEVLNLSMNNNGTHFVQKCVITFDKKYLNGILKTLLDNYVEFANNPQGLCVLKHLMNKFTDSESSTLFINKSIQNIEVLIQSPFGNYAIQHAYEVIIFIFIFLALWI